jgi:hypothetical protein
MSLAGISCTSISFGADGDALKPVYIIEIKDGQWKLIDKHPAG